MAKRKEMPAGIFGGVDMDKLLSSEGDSQRTQYPYVTGTSVIGIKYKYGILMAADMGGKMFVESSVFNPISRVLGAEVTSNIMPIFKYPIGGSPMNGMGEGWSAKPAGTKLSVIIDGDLYAWDPSSSLESAIIKVYDSRDDT
ncbi:proteasome subunit beta type-4-like protein [Tanacetum coccineum]